MKASEFEQNIGYEFKDKELLNLALTHCSFNKERDSSNHDDNERLEFLGDAFLDAIVSVELYNRLKRQSEGRLTKTRAVIVCEKSLAEIAKRLNLGAYMNMGYGEDRAGGRHKDSILADMVEAIIGAIYMDSGYESARSFVLRHFQGTIDSAIEGKLYKDYKSDVQELLQKNGTVDTLMIMTESTINEMLSNPKAVVGKMKESIFLKEIYPKMLDYFETEHYLFLHGWLPCKEASEYCEEPWGGENDYHKCNESAWVCSRWYSYLKKDEIEDSFKIEKTIVCGHRSARYGHELENKMLGKVEEQVDFTPFYGDGYIAIDGTTMLSGKVNCLIIED